MLTVLSGGTGSVKFVRGLTKLVGQENLTVIANVGDNIKLHGLYICPDIDTIMYMFSGLLDRKKGWGIFKDAFKLQKMLGTYGLETWFNLGDMDLATHIYRTCLLDKGLTLTEATKLLTEALGVRAKILPATDSHVETKIITESGEMHLQEFLIKRRCEDKVLKVVYEKAEYSQPAPGVLEVIDEAEAILISPANPLTSIRPILSIPKIKNALENTQAKVLAVSPIMGGSSIGGPAGKMMEDLGFEVSAYTVATLYKDFLDLFLIHHTDVGLKEKTEALGIKCIPTDIIMNGVRDERRLASFALKTLGC